MGFILYTEKTSLGGTLRNFLISSKTALQTINCIADLKKLHEKNKIHIAAEGGEYETFVLDCPMFRKKIKIKNFNIIMENECTGQYIIRATEFVKK